MSLTETEQKQIDQMVSEFTKKNKVTASTIERAIKSTSQPLKVITFKKRAGASTIESTFTMSELKDIMRMIRLQSDEPDEGIRVYNERDELIYADGACDYD